MTKKVQFVRDLRDLKDKEQTSGAFLIKFSTIATGKNGKAYMNLVLMDKTGEIEARIWDDVTLYAGQAVRDAFVWVDGRCQSYQGRLQLVIHRLQVLREDEVDPKDFISESGVNTVALYEKLLAYVESMQDPFYKALAEVILKDDPAISDLLKRAPAAKTMHHAYPGGLLEHLISITGILDDLSKHYGPIVDRDLLFMGGFLHDIGKIWELSYERVTDYTDEGQLIGHLVMGVELVTRKINELESCGDPSRIPGPFPVDKKLLVKHMILAHHGKLEYGSPKEPQCLEALIVHMVDDLDSKVNAVHRFMAQDQNPGRWTALNRHYGRFFYKPDALASTEKKI